MSDETQLKKTLTKAEIKMINEAVDTGLSRKALLESIARVTEDIGIDKRAGIIEQEIARKFKEGKMEKPPKPKPSMTLKGGKLRGVKDAPEELMREKRAKIGKALKGIAGVMKGLGKAATGPVGAIGKAGKKAGRLAKRGYGLARK